jgi:hypothetical protein
MNAANATYCLMGFTVKTKEQARSVLLVAKLKGLDHVVRQAMRLIEILPA